MIWFGFISRLPSRCGNGCLPEFTLRTLEDELALVEQAHAFELTSLCEDAAFSAIERLSETTVVQLIKDGLHTTVVHA